MGHNFHSPFSSESTYGADSGGRENYDNTPDSKKPSVVMVDDDIAIMRCVAQCLEREAGLRVVGFARHAQAGVALALDKKPDVVLMDVHMPGADAFWACREIVRQTKGEVKVLFYTGFPRDHYLDRCIASGGSGMLSKHTEALEDIGMAVRHVVRGNKYYSPELSKRLVEIEGEAPRSRLSTLNQRELEVLRGLAIGKTNREIADQLDLGLRSVEKCVSDIKLRLDLDTTNELLVFAANEGIVFAELTGKSRRVPEEPPQREENGQRGTPA